MAEKEVTGRQALHQLFADKGFKLGAEIGVQNGINALHMLKRIPGLKLYLVDHWPDRNQFARAKKRVSPYNVKLIRSRSVFVAPRFPDGYLDFVYIDADHSYDMVMLDVIMWSRVVRPGGIVSGHDYRRRVAKLGVKAAVDDYVKQHKIDLQFIGKRNWFWVK